MQSSEDEVVVGEWFELDCLTRVRGHIGFKFRDNFLRGARAMVISFIKVTEMLGFGARATLNALTILGIIPAREQAT